MSPLPQRKKSAEEIAKLRESLGIPGQEAGTEPLAVETAAPQEIPAAQAATPAPTVERMESLPAKRPGRVPLPPAEEAEPVEGSRSAPAEPTVTVLPTTRVVRSLRKSEQGTVQAPALKVVSDSKLPTHRHSDEEISRIRRMEAIQQMATQEKPRALSAHLALVLPGYLLPLVGAVGVSYYQIPLAVTATLAGTALLIAVFIFIRKPHSRHHAAFIFIVALFLTIFGALYYFPQIQYGT